MRLGSWIFIRTSDLAIKDYFPITMKRFIKSGRGTVTRTYINQPFLTMKYNGGEFYVRGNRPVWSLLDSVFPHDPLPRTPINNDLKTEHGKDALEGLLTDIDAWPYLRLHVRDGEGWDAFAEPIEGTWLLSASAASSDQDLTAPLVLLEQEWAEEGAYPMPITLQDKTKAFTKTCIVVPWNKDPTMSVVVVDHGDNYIVMSQIDRGSGFRPRKHSKHNDIFKVYDEIADRLWDFEVIDSMMKWWEMDDLEHRRFLSSPTHVEYRTERNSLTSLGGR